MKLNSKTIFKITTAFFVLLSAVLAVFRASLLKDNKAIDAGGLYTDANAGKLFTLLVFAMVAVTVVGYVLFRKKQFVPLGKSGIVTKIISAVCAVMMFMVIVAAFPTFAKGFDILLAIELVLCLFSAVYFLRICTEGLENGVKVSKVAIKYSSHNM